MTDRTTILAGRRVLIVEDDYFLAADLARDLAALGAALVGPVPSIDDALDLIESGNHIDGALLDLNLQGEMSYPVADVLLEKGIPFVFATGYDHSAIPSQYQAVARCEKPLDVRMVATALFG